MLVGKVNTTFRSILYSFLQNHASNILEFTISLQICFYKVSIPIVRYKHEQLQFLIITLLVINSNILYGAGSSLVPLVGVAGCMWHTHAGHLLRVLWCTTCASV